MAEPTIPLHTLEQQLRSYLEKQHGNGLVKTTPSKTASEVCDKIRSYITLLEQIYTAAIQP